MLGFTLLILVALVAVFVALSLRTIPQQSAFVAERLGKYYTTLTSGVNFLIPFVDRIAYEHTLKEQVIDVPEQICITKDNAQVAVDGVVFIQVMDAQKASYGVSDYHFAIVQLAQTTMRSEIGKIDLDKTFEERGNINSGVVKAVDEAAQQWGVKTLRYEIKNITPPKSVLEAMQKQMTAEREKRALILNSEGQKQSAINVAEGKKQQAILESEGEKQRRINEAEGNAQAIQRIAEATGKGILEIAKAINESGGFEAVQFRIADKLADQFGQIAKVGNTIIVPASFSDLSALVATTMGVIKKMSPSPQSS